MSEIQTEYRGTWHQLPDVELRGVEITDDISIISSSSRSLDDA